MVVVDDEPEVRSGTLVIGSPLPGRQVADTIVSYWHQVCQSMAPLLTLMLLTYYPLELHFGSRLGCYHD